MDERIDIKMSEIKEMALHLIEALQLTSYSQSPAMQMVMNWTSSFSPSPSPLPGSLAREKGWKAKHPVVLIPGFVTSGLEVWRGQCSNKTVSFRGRLWGKLEMVQVFLRDSKCWLESMSLDSDTGLDPEGITVRAAHGLSSLDYFVEGFWVFSKIIETLGEIGYVPETNLVAASFDWRLSIPMLEKRDKYFSRLKQTVEGLVSLNDGEKVVLISHSFGENVARSFMTWMGGSWCEQHLEAFVNLAGSTLGIPKAASALLSGEMKDTVSLGPLSAYLANALVPIESRTMLFRTWGSLLAMLPVGGNKIWREPLFTLTHASGRDDEHLDASEAIRMMLNEANLGDKFEKWGPRVVKDAARGKGEAALPFFPDATLVPLPSAPSLSIYCIYGVGLVTETGYAYKQTTDTNSSIRWRIDPSHSTPSSSLEGGVRSSDGLEGGVRSSDGDLTVPLISLGAMCAKGWRSKRLNPASMRVVLREKNHSLSLLSLDPRERGGAQSGHHVDVLGNEGLLNDILAIVSGRGSMLEDEVVSNINQLVEEIDFET